MWISSRCTRSLFAKAAIVIAVASLGGSAQAELLTNADFNTDADASGGPDGWSNWMYGPTAFAAYKNDAANDPFDLNGTAYVNAGNYGDWWSSGGGWNQQVAGSGGTPYTFSAFCATEGWDNAAGEIRIIYLGEFGLELQRDVRHTADYQANLAWAPFTTTSIAPAGTQLVKVELATWGARGAVLWDDSSLNTASIWNVDAGGSAADTNNWLGGSPSGVDAAARFLGAISDNRTVSIDAPLTLGSLSFVNPKSYVLAGSSTLRLETSAAVALVDVQSGVHHVGLPTTVASDAYFAVSSGATLEIGGPLTVAAGKSVRPSGDGTISYQSSVALESNAGITFASDSHLTSLTLASGASAAIRAHGASAARTITVNSLALAADAKVDVADNKLVVAYTGASAVGTIRDQIATAYNAGAWNGNGITSTAITAGHAIGYADSGSSVTVQLAYVGDATLDGIVNFDDLLALAQNYGMTGTATWSKGDFNYTAAVDFDDLLALAQMYGTGAPALLDPSDFSSQFSADWALARSMVPEPTSLALLATCAMLGRRRNSQPLSGQERSK